MTTCEARIGYTPRPEGWGQTPIHCTQSVGLRSLRDATGQTRRYCTRDGHRYSVVRRFGEWAPEDWAPGELTEAFGR